MSKKHKSESKPEFEQTKIVTSPSEADLQALIARVSRLEAEKAQLEAKLAHTEPKHKSRFAWRKVGVGALVLVGTISLAAANLSAWADRTLVNTDTYVETVAPVASDPAVQTAIQAYAFQELTARVNYEQLVKDVLPDEADILAIPLATQLKNYSNQLIGEIVKSDQFATVWVTVNRQVHELLITRITNYEGDGKVDVSQIYEYISQQLENTPLKVLANQTLPANIGQIQVLDLSGFKAAHDALNTLNMVRIWSWVIAFASFIGAVFLSRRRMHTLMWVGISIIIMSVVTVIAFRVTRTYALDQIVNPLNQAAALSMWTILLRGLFEQTGGILAFGFVVATGSWLASGQGRIAGVRASMSHQANRLSQGIWKSPDTSVFVRGVTRYKRSLEWVAVVIGVLVLMLFSPLSMPLVIGTAVGILVAILVIEFIASASMNNSKNKEVEAE